MSDLIILTHLSLEMCFVGGGVMFVPRVRNLRVVEEERYDVCTRRREILL